MHPKYSEVIKLRKVGKSYREIAKIIGISKNSISRWCRNLKIPLVAQKTLEKKFHYPRELFKKYNELKSKKVNEENERIKKTSATEIQKISERELKLVGAALYWGEGQKRWSTSDRYIHFVNSDPLMIALFLRFARKVLNVAEEKIRVAIHIYPNMNRKLSINFWSKTTGILKERFKIITQISRSSQRKRPFNSLPYGTLDVRIRSRRDYFQIEGWINGLARPAKIKN